MLRIVDRNKMRDKLIFVKWNSFSKEHTSKIKKIEGKK